MQTGGKAMSERTEVDPDALGRAAGTTSRLSGEVRAASGACGPAMARAAAALAGARSQAGVTSVRQAAGGLLDDLGQALAGLSTTLAAAARDYADAERAATPTTQGVPRGPGQPK